MAPALDNQEADCFFVWARRWRLHWHAAAAAGALVAAALGPAAGHHTACHAAVDLPAAAAAAFRDWLCGGSGGAAAAVAAAAVAAAAAAAALEAAAAAAAAAAVTGAAAAGAAAAAATGVQVKSLLAYRLRLLQRQLSGPSSSPRAAPAAPRSQLAASSADRAAAAADVGALHRRREWLAGRGAEARAARPDRETDASGGIGWFDGRPCARGIGKVGTGNELRHERSSGTVQCSPLPPAPS
eukprot:354318-Chlamydomonas_euryale.AAC.12